MKPIIRSIKSFSTGKKTIGDTSYKFAPTTGKKPELCDTSKYPRSTKEIKIRHLRDWQSEAFNRLKNSKFFLVKAFCGSGKTTLSMVLAIWDLIFNKRKQLFIVPQSHIGDGFSVSGKFNIPGLGKVSLARKPQNLCDDSDKKTDVLVEFLLDDFNEKNSVKKVPTKKGKQEYVVFGDKYMACATHQCFVAAINKIIERENNGEVGLLDKALKNLGLSIDEAHHIRTKNGDAEELTYNRLGKILNTILERADKNNTRVGLTTATFFRGDQGIIVSADDLEKFDRYELDFLSHFETLEIENVFVHFEEYKKDPIKQIVDNIESELKTERHLIVVPTGSEHDGEGAKWRKLDTHLIRLKNELKKMLERNGLSFDDVVLDLVDKETQKRNKNILLKEPKECYDKDETKNSKIRIVITCMLGREGTDWCPCSRLHNASIELGSTTLAVQTLGRLFRKFEGKNKVGVTYYVKEFESLDSSSTKREYFSNRVNAILGLMLIDEWMHPILLPELPEMKHEGAKRRYSKKKTKTKYVRLSDVYSHEDFEKMRDELITIQSLQDDFNESSSEEIIKSIVSKYKKKKSVSDDDVVAGFKVFLLRARSETLRSAGIDISFVREHGFDLIVEKHKLGGNFWMGVLTGKTLKKYRELIKKLSWTKEQSEELKNNIIALLSKKMGRKIIESDKGDEKIIRKITEEFCNFHNAYNNVARVEESTIPSHRGLADQLNISIEVLQEKIKLLNQIPPKGYKFFDKKSKITEKLSPAA